MSYELLTKQDMQARIQEIKDKKYVYVYGAKYTGKPITTAQITALRDSNSQVYSQQYYMDTVSRAAGKYAIDCSGLVCYIWGIKDIGSWQIHDLSVADGFKSLQYESDCIIKFGDVLWKEGHVGFVEDNTTTFEAAGLYTGVGNFSRTAKKWERIIRPIRIVEKVYPEIGWKHESDGTWWYNYGYQRGEYYTNTIVKINGQLYAFDQEGWLVKNPTMVTNSIGAIATVNGERFRS